MTIENRMQKKKVLSKNCRRTSKHALKANHFTVQQKIPQYKNVKYRKCYLMNVLHTLIEAICVTDRNHSTHKSLLRLIKKGTDYRDQSSFSKIKSLRH